MPICAAHDVAFLLNDRMDLAAKLGCDGVHLGQSDGDPAAARALLGPKAQIGRTCHDSRHFAMEAGEVGADYVAFGAFYPTTTHATRYRPDPSIPASCRVLAQSTDFQPVGEQQIAVEASEYKVVDIPIELTTLRRATSASVRSCTSD